MPTAPDAAPFLIAPDPSAPRLTRVVRGVDHAGQAQEISVVEERPLTIYLNSQEIVTAMTIGDYPEYLALGFLRNQAMLGSEDVVTGVDYDADLEVVVVRTARQTSHEDKLKKKTRTSGCAVGTVFGDMMEGLEDLTLPEAELRRLGQGCEQSMYPLQRGARCVEFCCGAVTLGDGHVGSDRSADGHGGIGNPAGPQRGQHRARSEQ